MGIVYGFRRVICRVQGRFKVFLCREIRSGSRSSAIFSAVNNVNKSEIV